MQEDFRLVHYDRKTGSDLYPVRRFGPEKAQTVAAFHRSFPGYAPTPLCSLKNLAAKLGVGAIYVKDESKRFSLNAFKVLGGSFAIGSYIAQKLGMDIAELPFERMTSPEIKKKLGDVTFITATDGNHGRGVAWTANRLGQKSIVYMPKGTAAERLANIRVLGSDASITDLIYDDCVRLAKDTAEKRGYVLVQDTSWPGYEEIPGLIMEGYTTLAQEAMDSLCGEVPTHVFLQAGVGSMAACIAGYFAALCGPEKRPIITIIEPDGADCIYRTAAANDGKLHIVSENMYSIMAGLCCGEPCTIAWDVLKDHADNFVSMPDYAAAQGMRILGNPLGDDPRIISGESGASAFGFVAEVLENKELEDMKKMLQLDEHSRILCISTEGDTDRENYRRIVWDGAYPAPKR